eukprot:TRINITY_DN67111_c0_g10_i1.p2 TRINITY_DN67111_c0_g10~~TRINITY_DN67111_c0_g10_i1.p2  ORF type:complete len:297 (-),score=27.04 TRINITY_DN67111_c0_g10_i1:162-1052(-)
MLLVHSLHTQHFSCQTQRVDTNDGATQTECDDSESETETDSPCSSCASSPGVQPPKPTQVGGANKNQCKTNNQPPLEQAWEVDEEWGPMPPHGYYCPSEDDGESEEPTPNWCWSYPKNGPQWDDPNVPIPELTVEADSRPFPQLTWPLSHTDMRLNTVSFEGDLSNNQIKKLRKLFKGWEARAAHEADVHLVFINTQQFPMEKMQYLSTNRIFGTLAPQRGDGRLPQSGYIPTYRVTFTLQSEKTYCNPDFNIFVDKGGWLHLRDPWLPDKWRQVTLCDASWPEVETWPSLPNPFC